MSQGAGGVSGARGWGGGFGVAPRYRGQGMSHGLMGALLDHARRIGVRDVALEVLVQNAPAIRTYKGGASRTVAISAPFDGSSHPQWRMGQTCNGWEAIIRQHEMICVVPSLD